MREIVPTWRNIHTHMQHKNIQSVKVRPFVTSIVTRPATQIPECIYVNNIALCLSTHQVEFEAGDPLVSEHVVNLTSDLVRSQWGQVRQGLELEVVHRSPHLYDKHKHNSANKYSTTPISQTTHTHTRHSHIQCSRTEWTYSPPAKTDREGLD